MRPTIHEGQFGRLAVKVRVLTDRVKIRILGPFAGRFLANFARTSPSIDAADAHFFWCCRRATQLGVDIPGFPNVQAHFIQMLKRLSIKKRLAFEKEMNESFAKTA